MTLARGVGRLAGMGHTEPYRIPSDPPTREGDPWAEVRRRRSYNLCGAAVTATGAILAQSCGLPLLWLAVVPGMGLLAYGERAICPCCGKKFFRRNIFHNSLAVSCLNCRTRIGAQKAGT